MSIDSQQPAEPTTSRIESHLILPVSVADLSVSSQREYPYDAYACNPVSNKRKKLVIVSLSNL